MLKSLLICAAIAAAAAHATAAEIPGTGKGVKLYGDADRGADVVRKWCVGCHSAGPNADDRIPTLSSLAANPARSEGAIRAFLMQPHKPMPPLEISTQQIEDIVAYLRAFRAQTAPSR